MRATRAGIITAVVVATLGFAGCGSATGGAAEDAPDRLDESACAALADETVAEDAIGLPTSGAEVTDAAWASGDVDDRCEVTGEIRPVDPEAPPITFQVNLPEEWNGKAVQMGGGGYDGQLITGLEHYDIQPSSERAPIEQGYVTLGSDGGHSSEASFDASFGMNDEALRNYGQESIKKTHDVAMALVDAAYDAEPEHTYFIGFSQGGHEALDAAGRYPDDYDGVVAGTPSYNVTMMHAGIGSLFRDALYGDGGKGWISPEKTATITDAVYGACDGLDGLEDGVISDVAGCLEAFDIATLRCEGGKDTGDDCLSDAQLATAKRLADGKDLGFDIAGNSTVAGSPILTGGTFDAFGLGQTPQPSAENDGTQAFQYTVLDAISRFIITRDPDSDPMEFDLDRWRERIQEVGTIMDSTDVDFSAARDAGVKIILFTGLADAGIPPENTIQLWDRQVDRFGEEDLDDFWKFYTVPGFSHGFGPFDAHFDALGALEAWAEEDEEPESLTVVDENPDQYLRERPLCEYPSWPKATGNDDRMASAFTCVEE